MKQSISIFLFIYILCPPRWAISAMRTRAHCSFLLGILLLLLLTMHRADEKLPGSLLILC